MLAEKAIALIGAVPAPGGADGNDLEAREGMALAATLAGMAFSNVGVAVVHALEYPVGGADALLARRRQRPAVAVRDALQPAGAAQQEFAAIARLLGEDMAGLSEDGRPNGRSRPWSGCGHDIGIPEKLRELGVKEEQLRPFAEGLRHQTHPARQSAAGDRGGTAGDLSGGVLKSRDRNSGVRRQDSALDWAMRPTSKAVSCHRTPRFGRGSFSARCARGVSGKTAAFVGGTLEGFGLIELVRQPRQRQHLEVLARRGTGRRPASACAGSRRCRRPCRGPAAAAASGRRRSVSSDASL